MADIQELREALEAKSSYYRSNLNHVTGKTVRRDLERALGLDERTLDNQKEEIDELIQEVRACACMVPDTSLTVRPISMTSMHVFLPCTSHVGHPQPSSQPTNGITCGRASTSASKAPVKEETGVSHLILTTCDWNVASRVALT